jgi:two-component system, OmpR family, response regulator ChvI
MVEKIDDNDQISFQRSDNYCVCFVDMVESTRITMAITEPRKIRAFYSIFLNTTATIASSFGAKLVKNAGDAIIFYFPKTYDPSDRTAFRDALECCNTIIASRDFVNMKLHSEGIEESINFRISVDYGVCQVASSIFSRTEDLFGPTMNICSKINRKAQANTIVIGEDMFRILKSLSLYKDYKIKELKGYSADSKHSYTVYSLSKNASANNLESKIADPFQNLKSYDEQVVVPRPADSNVKNDTDHQYGRTIMIVDDEPDILLVYKSYLLSEGYNVEAFADPQEALEYFAKINCPHYDLVVMDIRMPQINGFELYRMLKAIKKDLRILFVSALDVAEELLTLMPELENEDFVRKPVTKDRLLETIKSKLNSPASIAS